MFDVAVIGGGPGGYAAAVRAAQRGARVALVERERLGGTCLHKGCIPTKALLQTAEVWETVRRAAAFGVRVGETALDYAAATARKDAVVEELARGLEQLMKARRVTVLRGRGTIPAPGRVRVEDADGVREEEIEAAHIVIATGSRPAVPPIPGADAPLVLDSDRLLALREVPHSLAVVGGGFIGVEMATLFAALGARVTVIEALPEILPGVDGELKRRLHPLLRRAGVAVRTATAVLEIAATDTGGAALRLREPGGGEAVLEAERVLLATGRAPDWGGLDLAALGVAHDRGGIKIDDRMATGVPGVWAAGDVTGGRLLAHVAADEGLVAAENITGGRRAVDRAAVPLCLFSRPELAAVGLTEDAARERGVPYRVGRFPFAASGRAATLGEKDGLVKVVAGEDGRVLGVHILGPHACELIHEGVLAVRAGVTVREMAEAIHAHPTLAEALNEAARDVSGEAVHVVRRESDNISAIAAYAGGKRQ